MSIGECIRSARKKAGLTQAQLAEKSGVAAISIHQYEAGKRQPRLEQLTRISKALGIHLFDLVGIGDQMRKLKVEFVAQEPLSQEQEAKLAELLSIDQYELYNISSDETKKGFWEILFESDSIPKFRLESNRERISNALNQMTEDGREKVADYAEDILPRYRREEAPKPGTPSTDTHSEETPTEDT